MKLMTESMSDGLYPSKDDLKMEGRDDYECEASLLVQHEIEEV